MSGIRFTRAFCMVAMLSGCHGLAGQWEGEISCEGADEDVDVKIDLVGVTATKFVGDGEAGDDLALCKGEFKAAMKTDESGGAQSVDVELEACKLTCTNGSEYMNCGNARKGKWDGNDKLTFELDHCEFDLERDSIF